MIHCLYKCFCKFKSIEGHRFEFSSAKIDVIDQPIYTKKRQYTFERSIDDEQPPNKVSRYMNTTYPPIEDDNDYSSCRRVRVVATNHHKIINRARSEDIRRRIRKIELEHPRLKLILRKRVKQSIAMSAPSVTATNSFRNTSGMSNVNQSMTERNISGHSMRSVAMDRSVDRANKSSELPANDSCVVDPNTIKYRSRFNNIIMKTMQGISHKLKTMTALPSPANKAFYYMQWLHFLEAFNTDRIYIWEVQLNNKEVLLVVTDKNIMPIVSNAMYVINIKAVSTERLPLLPKLIKLGVINEETEKMSILLFGISNYWRVLGCTHSDKDFMNERVVAVPTPDSNPRLASKISSLFNDMVKWTAKNRSKESIKSNLCIRQLDETDIDNIRVPIPVVGCHRWLMLSIANDFTHIFVPAWKQFISHKRIVSAIEHAKRTQRTVRMGPMEVKPHVYVPHGDDSNMKVFFGPMQKNESLDLQLLQESDGKMLLREDFQRIAKQQPKNLTYGMWLYMKDDHMVIGDHKPNTQIRTYPPKLKYFNHTKPSTSTARKFIQLKPSTVTSTAFTNNMNITIMSPGTSEGFSNCTTSTPSTSSSGNVPSSELIRHLSLGLRARPAKNLNESTVQSSPIKVVDTKLLMSPQFMPESSSSFISSSTPNLSKEDQSIASSIQSKAVTLSMAPKMQSNTEWKDVSKGVPIRKRRFTTIVSTDKPTLKSMLEKPLLDKPSATLNFTRKLLELPPNLVENNSSMPKRSIPKSIRDRRYTTIVSTGTKSFSKGIHQNSRPPTSVKNFELVQNPGSKELTLAPIPAKPVNEAPTQLTLNRPVVIKKIDAADSVVQSTANKQLTNVKLVTSTTATKLSTAPIVVVKPSSFNLNFPKKVSTASIALDGKSVVMKKIGGFPTVRLTPSNIKILRKGQIIKNIREPTQVIDATADERTAPVQPPRLQQISALSMHAGTNNTILGYVISQNCDLGKIKAKKLFAAYSLSMPDGAKLFQTFKQCSDYLNL